MTKMNAVEACRLLSGKYKWVRHEDYLGILTPNDKGKILDADMKEHKLGCSIHVENIGYLCYDFSDTAEVGNDGTVVIRVTTGSGRVFVDTFTPVSSFVD